MWIEGFESAPDLDIFNDNVSASVSILTNGHTSEDGNARFNSSMAFATSCFTVRL